VLTTVESSSVPSRVPDQSLCCNGLSVFGPDLGYGAEPVVEVVAVVAAALHIEVICAATDLFFNILTRLGRRRFRRQDGADARAEQLGALSVFGQFSVLRR